MKVKSEVLNKLDELRALTKAQKELMKELKLKHKEDCIEARAQKDANKKQRSELKESKAKKKEEKRKSAIIKAEARLQKLQDAMRPVGVKARKADKKPSKVVITKPKA